MKDFFDDLERQLVEATPQRRARVRRARARRAAAVASMIVVLLAGGAGIAAAVSGSDGDAGDGHGAPAARTAADHFTRTTIPPQTTQTTVTPPPPGPAPYSYEVAVLNGTTVPGLGRAVTMRLAQREIRAGYVTNATTHDEAVTRVYYRTPDCLPAANQVAAALHVGADHGDFALERITKAQTTLVGEGPAVVVVVGADQDSARRP